MSVADGKGIGLLAHNFIDDHHHRHDVHNRETCYEQMHSFVMKSCYNQS